MTLDLALLATLFLAAGSFAALILSSCRAGHSAAAAILQGAVPLAVLVVLAVCALSLAMR